MKTDLQQHLEIKNPSTMTAREMLHIGADREISRYDLNFAGNTYLVALDEIKRLEAEIVNLKTIIAKDDKYIVALESDLRDGTDLVTKAVTE